MQVRLQDIMHGGKPGLRNQEETDQVYLVGLGAL